MKKRRPLSHKRRLTLLIPILAIAILPSIPLGVHAVQNIFTGLEQITDIQYGGTNIDQIVYQGTTIWERQEAPTGTNIQQVGSGKTYLCPTARTRVVDARDGATYWIRKINDLCWMETNLAYAGGGNNTYGDAVSAITQGMTSDYATAYYDVPTGSNKTTGTTDPSTSTNGTGQYGYLYNWCAAMANQPAACQGTVATQPDTTISICPAGWRLPTGDSGGEFEGLNAAINSDSTTTNSGLLTDGLYMYSGNWDSGSFAYQGSRGYYWSSAASATTNAYNLYFNIPNVYPTRNSDKRYGAAVRCVAE